MKWIPSIIFILLFQNALSQKYTIYGVIKDITSGELLIGATIWNEKTKQGTSSNNYGFYSISLPEGEYNIQFSFIGYKSQYHSIKLGNDTLFNIELQSELKDLDEITVTSKKKDRVSDVEMSTQTLSIQTIKEIPAIMGETDVMKSLQFLPGVLTSHEGTANLSIRGGSFDQNLILLDDAPVYNPTHALGFFSTFNPDAISSVKIYKAAYPPEYGGRISSVIDIRMKEGNNKTLKGSGGVGLVSSKLTLEGPIKKDTASFILSGRYSYAGFTANTFGNLGQRLGLGAFNNFTDNNEVSFFDFNAKANYKINNKNHLYLSAYTGRDHFYYFTIDDNSAMDWGNINSTCRWNHIFNSKLFANTIVIFSNYYYAYILKDNALHYKWSSNLKEFDFKSDFDYYLNTKNHLKFGLAVESHYYSPGKIEPRSSRSIITPFELDKKKAVIGAVYVNNEQQINNQIIVSYGLRYSSFFQLGENITYDYSDDFAIIDSTYYGKNELVQFYHGLEPRISIRYLINNSSSVKASFTKSKQFQHLISNSTVGLPTDVWLPADKYIKPQSSTQYAVGYFKKFFDDHVEFSAEAYYKTMNDIIDYKDNADLMLNNHIETQALRGKGKSYGLELFLKKKVGRYTGWISYTLSKTSKKIEGVNNGNWYPVQYDKRHNLSAILNYKLNNRWSVATTFKYSSGGHITIPEGVFNFQGVAFNYYTSRNGYELPAYHRLDLSFTYKERQRTYPNKSGEWNFGIYNVYDQRNIFSLFIKQDRGNLNLNKAYKMYLYGIIPFVSYNFKF